MLKKRKKNIFVKNLFHNTNAKVIKFCMKTKCPNVSTPLSLATAKQNENYVIKQIDKSLFFKIKRRIMELGFFAGERVVVLKKSLQGKTFLVSLNGCVFSIRKDVAEKVFVENVGGKAK